MGEFSCDQPTCPQLHPQLSISWPLILSHTVIKIKMQPNELCLEAGLARVHPPWKAFSSRNCLLWFLLSLNLPCLQVYVSEGQSQSGKLEECRPEVGWGGAIMGPQSFSSLERAFWLSIMVVPCPETSKTLIYINIFFIKCPSLRYFIMDIENLYYYYNSSVGF